MIERKRHNDSLRRREFEMLRQQLRHEAATRVAPAVPPLLFHSSVPSGADGRATTLRKINEIEAQMSSQWRPVKTRQTARRPALPSLSRRAVPPSALTPTEMADTTASCLLRTVVAVTPPPMALRAGGGFDKPTQRSSHSSESIQPETLPTPAGEDFQHDPDLEEAALRFASGDAAGAEAALQAMLLPDHPLGAQRQPWLCLFDLYRVGDQPARYDDLGAAFARRFQCSPPQWRGLEAPGSGPAEREEAHRAFPLTLVGEPAFHWTCPAVLDAAGVASLQATLAPLPQPWSLAWGALSCLAPEAVAPLAQWVAEWARQPVRLRMAGVYALERILDAHTACGDHQGDPSWWTLRLHWLRALRRPDEFELVALDYCVTYEVSPPSWEAPRCDLRVLDDADTDAPRQPVTALESRLSILDATGPATGATTLPPAGAPCLGELAGSLSADTIAVALSRLAPHLPGSGPLLISCERLLRLDFEAAGALANWVADRRREGRVVHLVGVHRLVAVLLGALGLATQARISLRRD
jgi:ABC-type transporter Mla MlaB component